MKIEMYDKSNINENSTILNEIIDIEAKVFNESFHKVENLKARLDHKNFLILMAYENENIVGFKVGFEEKSDLFYSWIGGVIPEYRRQKIAFELMKVQHAWLKENGYQFVTTRTENQFKDMLILNLRCGFDVVGTIEEYGRHKIILRKELINP